jgi:hypothetical protein
MGGVAKVNLVIVREEHSIKNHRHAGRPLNKVS